MPQVNDKGEDQGDSSHVARARVHVKLRDINDNRPIFDRPNIEVRMTGLQMTLAAWDGDFGEGMTQADDRLLITANEHALNRTFATHVFAKRAYFCCV